MFNRIVVAIYIHPDFYPPTINAINFLSSKCKELIVVTRNNCTTDFPKISNVKFIKIGNFITPKGFEQKNVLIKIFTFLKFTLTYYLKARSRKTDLIINYDPTPLFSNYLFNFLLPKRIKKWYHNHDIPEAKNVSKFSISWFVTKFEHKGLLNMNFFSLPSNDRINFYPKIPSSIKYFFIPNFPSKKIYSNAKHNKLTNENEIRIIFQGSIGRGHGIEEIIMLMNEKVNNKKIYLVLKGSIKQDYKDILIDLATKNNVLEQIKFIGIGLYKDLQDITKSCDIGIAIHTSIDIMNSTLGTASNKIYEYAACGLPILLFDNEQFKKNLIQYKWAFFTDCTKQNLLDKLSEIENNYTQLSMNARLDFEKELNFEQYFPLPSLLND